MNRFKSGDPCENALPGTVHPVAAECRRPIVHAVGCGESRAEAALERNCSVNLVACGFRISTE